MERFFGETLYKEIKAIQKMNGIESDYPKLIRDKNGNVEVMLLHKPNII